MTGGGRLQGRAVLVAGATGMAAAAAHAFAAEGARVFAASRTAEHARDLAAAIEAAGGECAWLAADLTREPDADGVVEACVAAFGRVDGLYTVAGISGRRYGDGPLHELTLGGWQAVMTGNATSTFLACRAVVRQMLRQEPGDDGLRGAILTMSSVLALHPSSGHFATHAYAASKGAIIAFSRTLASYYAPHGIRVNVIAPALVATPMSQRAQGDPAILSYLREKQPLSGGPIDAADTVGTAVFLLSREARMVTGQVVEVDGGWTVSEPGRTLADEEPGRRTGRGQVEAG